jgi:hypothetical protein
MAVTPRRSFFRVTGFSVEFLRVNTGMMKAPCWEHLADFKGRRRGMSVLMY